MKVKVLFSLLALGFALQTGHSQITLTSANMPTAGKTTLVVDCDSAWTVAQNIGTAGANQTWDFSTAIAVGDPYPTIFVAPATTPWAADFPTASLASTDVVTDSSFYNFHKSTTSEFSIMGSKDPFSDLKYTPALKQFTFPFTYLTKIQQTSNVSGSSDGTPIFGTQKDTIIADAWGMVTTKLGTFPCLRVKSIIHQSLTIFIFQITVETVQYDWWTPNYVAPVFTYSTSKTDFLGEISEATFSSYLSGQSVGSHNPQAVEIGLSISPNPTSDQAALFFSLKTAKKVDFLVYSSDGKLALAERSVSLPVGENRQTLDLGGLPNGMYLVSMVSGGRLLGMQQLVVAH